MNERLHKSIYGQTLDEMKEDKGAWEYKQDKPKNTLDDLWKNIKKWEIESHIDTLRNIIKVSDRSDCGIKEIDGTDEEAIMFAINALEQIKAEQEPYICDTCKHNNKEWDEEPCDGCCGNHSGFEPKTQMVDKSNFDIEQYKIDLQCAYDCGRASVEPSGDLINRQAVLNIVRGCNTALEEPRIFDCHNAGVKFEQYITDLPSVNPQPKTGHWKRISMDRYTTHAQYWYECDKCGEHNLGNTNFCPNCGAKMVEQESEEQECTKKI